MVNLITQVQTAAANQQMQTMAQAMGMDVPSPGGDGSLPMSSSSYTIDTNGLWLEITYITNGLASLNLNNATNQVYAIWSTTNLLGNWNVETEVWPDTNQNQTVTPFTVLTLARQNLFMQAEDWTGVTENGNTTPDWWFWEYFGMVALSDTNLDGEGNTLLYDYTQRITPVAFQFTAIETTNNYFNMNQAPAQLVVSGFPYYIAILVDDANFADANWTAYTSSSITVNLGLTEGWHEVGIGLRGHADDPSAAVWQWKRLKLDLTPPTIVVTNPTTSTVSVPMIQVLGYCSEELGYISYDLTNAAGLVTNQDAGITGQFYSTNTWEFTTNYFECVDVPLTNGLNIITLHATDMAGNVTTTNFSFTLDYSSRTNPPMVRLYWPQDGTLVCNSQYTWRGWVDDPTATVTAQLVDTNGNTNIYNGIVERNGNFWVENLPLNGGTNYLTLTVTDSAGNIAATNIMVLPSAVGLTINTPSSDQLWNQNVTVTGTIDDSSDYTVWVNGVMATLNGDGTWTATNVFLPPGGTAVIQARAIPNSDNGGNGTGGSGGGPVTYDNLGNPDPPQDQDAEIQTDKPWRLYVLNDTQHSEEMDHFHEVGTDCYNEGCSATSDSQTTTTLTSTWVDGSGGFGSQSGDDNGQSSGNCIGTSVGMSLDGGQVFWPPSSWPNLLSGQEIDTWLSVVTGPQPCTYSTSETNDVLPVIGSEYCDVSDPLPATYGSGETSSLPYGYWVNSTNEMDGTYTRHAQTTWHLQTGGKSGRQSLWAIGAWASEILYKRALPLYDGLYVPMQGIPSTSITVMRKTLGSDGNLYKMLPANDDCDVTPKVDGKDFYTFGVGATKYTPYITANGANLDNETPEFCVGQGVTFALNGLPGFVDAVGHWNLPGNFVNEPFPYSSSCTSYRRNDNLLAITGQNLTTPCWYVNQPGGTVGVNANLHFSNGQYVSVAADGNFTIYRPTVSSFHNDGNGFEKTTFGLQGTMVWDATIDSTYNGFIGVTQIISCDNGNSDYYTLGLNLLDGNTEIYGEPGSLGVPKRYDPTDPNTQFTMLGDSPWDPFHPMCANMIANFKDYIRFQPDGGIFVTLATVDWHMNGNACLVGPISPDDLPPANPPVDSDAFPLWDSVRPE